MISFLHVSVYLDQFFRLYHLFSWPLGSDSQTTCQHMHIQEHQRNKYKCFQITNQIIGVIHKSSFNHRWLLQSIKRVVTEVLDDVAPLQVKKKPFGQKRNFWLSKEARDAKKHRRRLERRWKRTGAEDTRVEYRESCRSTNRLITDSRKKYFSDKISQSDDSRGRWSVVKNLLHSNGIKRILRTPDEARLFCVSVAQFFHNKCWI